MKDKVFHVISNTHWDREWRFSFQRNRQMLVEMIDEVLDILVKEPKYRAFHLDSQSIVLDDYLGIRPDKKDLIKKLVKENRLLIGPWYILPDEFHVGGENLIRNLLLGHKTCEELGGVSKTGYSPFSWGQISQLPQIYKQFGIDVIMFYRGVNSLDSKKAEFLWEGADGTTSITSRFSTMPRYNFYFYIYRPVVHNEKIEDAEYQIENGGILFHFSDRELYTEDYFMLTSVDNYYKENIIPSVNEIIKNQVDDFTTKHVVWMEGHDSSGPNIKTVRIIDDIKASFPGIKVVHSTLENYTKELKKNVNMNFLKVVKGERRSAQYDNRSGNLYGYITSARMYLKKKNFESEKWLQRLAEPTNSLAGIFGKDINDKYLDIAWNYLIQNSAHDSIGGCSLDEIHEDMMNRYKQVIEISKGVFNTSCKYLAKGINLKKFKKDSLHLCVLNLTNYKRDEVVEAVIDVPQSKDNGDIIIKDITGNDVAVQLIASSVSEPVLEQLTDRPMYLKMKRYNIYLEAKNIPSFGLNTFQIETVKSYKRPKMSLIGSIRKGVPCLENEYLKIKINTNGTLNIEDKAGNQIFKNTFYFYDEGEDGHAWVHKSMDPVINTLKSKPSVTLSENGSLSSSFTISNEIKIPVNKKERKFLNGRNVIIPVELKVTLKKGCKFADIKISLENKAESHRLRVMIPTLQNAKSSNAEGQFDVVKRPVSRINSSDWIEQPMYDYPMYHFVDVTDGNNGAAVFVQGLTEYEVKDDKQKTLAITLLRGFEYIIAPSSIQDYSDKKGSQCLGKHVYNMAFYPHKGNWNEGDVYEEALKFNTPLNLFEIGRTTGKIKPGTSFIKIEPKEIVFSCLKKAGNNKINNYVLRLYNPTDKKIKGKIKFSFDIKRASLVTLEEKKIENVLVTNNEMKITAGPKKIITLILELKPGE